ncbi:hypothetical protein QBC46DRAFT_451069 [Diplogelasinospora grovesii]|uniref:Uncharacterized protein n=1 Tax=Diplogelasinospora grovesii TaxID=303347 RepID=A0AAN6N4Y9_9PEZI|nr:hypothetical protein QBC46DRAFT_451069 [Diplogelasinospora grovesii]
MSTFKTLLLLTSSSLLLLKAAAQPATPTQTTTTPAWTPQAFPVPHPLSSPSMYVQSEPTGSACVAHLQIRSAQTCGEKTHWMSTTTVNLPVDCSGCAQVSYTPTRGGLCPLGGGGGGIRVSPTTWSATPYTHWSFICAASTPGNTPAWTTSLDYNDITKTLPLPVLPLQTVTGGGPAYTPVANKGIYYPDGGCYAALSVAPRETDQAGEECKRIRETTYTKTVTSSVAVDCGGCWLLSVSGDVHSCPEMMGMASTNGTKVVTTTTRTTAQEASTRWVYDCSARVNTTRTTGTGTGTVTVSATGA